MSHSHVFVFFIVVKKAHEIYPLNKYLSVQRSIINCNNLVHNRNLTTFEQQLPAARSPPFGQALATASLLSAFHEFGLDTSHRWNDVIFLRLAYFT